MAVERARFVMEGKMMKRIIVIIVSLFISILSFAQTDVQGDFWGVSFYGSRGWVSREFSKHATSERCDNPDELRFSNGYFGGQLWDTICAEFYKDNFCRISFISVYQDKKTAAFVYEELQRQLQQKYTSLYSTTDATSGNYNYVVFGEKRGCMLSFSVESDDFDTWYSIVLLYDCLALSQKRQDAITNEL